MGVKPNPKGVKIVESTTKEFQTVLRYIGYTQDYREKDIKKSVVYGLCTALMHLIIHGLSSKHG